MDTADLIFVDNILDICGMIATATANECLAGEAEKALERRRLSEENKSLRRKLSLKDEVGNVVGKSRLIGELETAVGKMDGALMAMGRCASFDEVRPYHLMASLVCAMAHVSISDDPESIAAAVRELCERGSQAADADALLQMIGIADGVADDPEVRHDAYAEAFGAAMRTVADENRPLVLVVEDAHWCDASSADVLSKQFRVIEALPVLGRIPTGPRRRRLVVRQAVRLVRAHRR